YTREFWADSLLKGFSQTITEGENLDADPFERHPPASRYLYKLRQKLICAGGRRAKTGAVICVNIGRYFPKWCGGEPPLVGVPARVGSLETVLKAVNAADSLSRYLSPPDKTLPDKAKRRPRIGLHAAA